MRDFWSRRFIINQIASAFLFGAINWAILGYWARNYLSFRDSLLANRIDVSLTSIIIVLIFILILTVPFWMSIVSSFALTERVVITPSDINVITMGIFAITLWYETNAISDYLTNILLAIFGLGVASAFENTYVSSFLGQDVQEGVPDKMFYKSSAEIQMVLEVLRNPTLQENIGLFESDEIANNEKITVFLGDQDSYKFYIAVYSKPKDDGTMVAIVGYEMKGSEVKPIKGFEDWVEGKYTTIATYMSKNEIKLDKETCKCILPNILLEYILKPLRGYLKRLSESVSATFRRLAIVISSLPFLYILWLQNITNPVETVTLFLGIVVWQFGPVALSKRKRLRRV